MQQQDRNIIEKLQQHTVAPPASVWNAIEKDLPSGASRSRRLMMFFGSLLTVMVLALVFWSLSGEDMTETQNISAHNQAVNVEGNNVITDQTVISEESSITETESRKEINSNLNNKEITKTHSTGVKNPEFIGKENKLKKEKVTSSQSSNISTQINTVAVNKQYNVQDNVSSTRVEVTKSAQLNDVIGAENTQLIQDTGNRIGLESGQGSSDRSIADIKAERSNHRTLAQLMTQEVDVLNATEESDWIGYRRKARMLNPCTYVYDQTCYDFGGGPPGESKVYLDIVGGPDFYSRRLTDRSTIGEFTDYADARNASETSELSWSIMARASLVTESGFAVRAGFLYEQTHERFEASRRVTMITLDTINGVPRVDTVSGTNTVTIYNKLKYLELPFMLGYEYQQNRLTMGINAGAALGLSFTQRGKILSPADDIVSITSDDNNRFPVFTGQAGLNLIGSFTIGYELTPRMQWIVEPNFRYRLGSVTIDSYPLEQKYSSFGLWTGIRFRL